jgi:hypothetical protein
MMSDKTQTQNTPWHDSVVQELHDIRTQLVEKYHGDMSAYSQAAKAHALALGFRFGPVGPGTTDLPSDGSDASTFLPIQASGPQRTPLAGNP